MRWTVAGGDLRDGGRQEESPSCICLESIRRISQCSFPSRDGKRIIDPTARMFGGYDRNNAQAPMDCRNRRSQETDRISRDQAVLDVAAQEGQDAISVGAEE